MTTRRKLLAICLHYRHMMALVTTANAFTYELLTADLKRVQLRLRSLR